ncbi:MAG: DUF5675 family protein [Bacteroides sp.]|nr:DUF5675 family protein [Bacteroides sp.]
MELILTRIDKRDACTMGRLEIDGRTFCDTLEPTWRNFGPGRPGKKVPGQTAIPEGRYPVVITHSPKLGQYLPLLLHVPGFSGIRIHAGNSPHDTQGCILVGNREYDNAVVNSRHWVRQLKAAIVEAKERGEGVWITVR